MLFLGAWGKMVHEKKPEVKSLVTLSLLKKTQLVHSQIEAEIFSMSLRYGTENSRPGVPEQSHVSGRGKF
jgi:hypothetical protein